MSGIINKGQGTSLLFSPCEDTVKSQAFTTRKRALIRTQACWHHDLELAAPQTVKNTFLLLTSCPVYSILIQQLELRQLGIATQQIAANLVTLNNTSIIFQFLQIRSLGTPSLDPLLRVSQDCKQVVSCAAVSFGGQIGMSLSSSSLKCWQNLFP